MVSNAVRDSMAEEHHDDAPACIERHNYSAPKVSRARRKIERCVHRLFAPDSRLIKCACNCEPATADRVRSVDLMFSGSHAARPKPVGIALRILEKSRRA